MRYEVVIVDARDVNSPEPESALAEVTTLVDAYIALGNAFMNPIHQIVGYWIYEDGVLVASDKAIR